MGLKNACGDPPWWVDYWTAPAFTWPNQYYFKTYPPNSDDSTPETTWTFTTGSTVITKESTVDCPICDKLYVVDNVNLHDDQSACPDCRKEARENMKKWENPETCNCKDHNLEGPP